MEEEEGGWDGGGAKGNEDMERGDKQMGRRRRRKGEGMGGGKGEWGHGEGGSARERGGRGEGNGASGERESLQGLDRGRTHWVEGGKGAVGGQIHPPPTVTPQACSQRPTLFPHRPSHAQATARAILRFGYYWYNFMPLARGTAACGYTAVLSLLWTAGMPVTVSIPMNYQVGWGCGGRGLVKGGRGKWGKGVALLHVATLQCCHCSGRRTCL